MTGIDKRGRFERVICTKFITELQPPTSQQWCALVPTDTFLPMTMACLVEGFENEQVYVQLSVEEQQDIVERMCGQRAPR